MIKVPTVTPPELEIRLANSREDLEQAYGILHDAYVESGFMAPHPSAMRITKYFMLPSTNTFIALWNGEIVGTMSVVRDSFFGLPLDQIFDISHLRKNGRAIAEISSLAIAAPFRHQRGQIFLPMVKFLFQYARGFLRIDDAVIAVNPDWEEFYRSVFLYERLQTADVGSYSFVNGAPAVGLHLNLETIAAQVQKTYARFKTPNLPSYFLNTPEPKRLIMPERQFIKVEDTFLSSADFRYFFIEKSDVLKSLSLAELSNLHMMIRDPKIRNLLPISIVMSRQQRNPRFPSELIATLPAHSSAVRVRNVSRYGLAIQGWTSQTDLVDLILQVSDQMTARVRGKVVWRDSINHSAGVQLIATDPVWANFVNWLESDDQAFRAS